MLKGMAQNRWKLVLNPWEIVQPEPRAESPRMLGRPAGA